jgi:hypothetical protein
MPRARARHRCKVNISVDLKDMVFQRVDRIQLLQVKPQKWALTKTSFMFHRRLRNLDQMSDYKFLFLSSKYSLRLLKLTLRTHCGRAGIEFVWLKLGTGDDLW